MERYLVLLMLPVVASSLLLTMPDYRDHPCRRTCSDGMGPMTCVYNFTVEWYHTLSKACYDCPFNVSDCERPHCVPADGFFRGVVTVNRMLPGPEIQVCHRDMIVVNVYNRLETAEITSIHWHGIHQKGYQYMDGVPSLTQCPIIPHSVFTYKFPAEPAGTHYWHSHSGLQRSDGMYGALVVRQAPSEEPHNRSDLYDEDLPEHVLIVTDWTHELTVQKFTSHFHAGDDNKAKGMLINGRGASVAVEKPEVPGKTVFTPRAKFTVERGKRYRFRVISNAVLHCPMQISVEKHDMLLIASDGQPIQPYVARTLVIYGGERFDFVLSANMTADNYWLRVVGLADCDEKFFAAAQTAIIHYSAAADAEPTSPTDYTSLKQDGQIVNPFNIARSVNAIQVSELRSLPQSLPDPALKPKPDYKFYLGMDFLKIDNINYNHPEFYPFKSIKKGMHLYTPQINNISNILPPSPILSQYRDIRPDEYCSHAVMNSKHRDHCPGKYCACLHRYKIKLGSVVEVILVDEGVPFMAGHAMHLHGYVYRVIGMDKIGEDINIDDIKLRDVEGKLYRNFENPPFKDTVIVPDGGYTILRFYANNPGEWFFHCHLLFHSELGMGLVFGVGEPSDLPPIPEHFPRCGSYTPGYYYTKQASSASRFSVLSVGLIVLQFCFWLFTQNIQIQQFSIG